MIIRDRYNFPYLTDEERGSEKANDRGHRGRKSQSQDLTHSTKKAVFIPQHCKAHGVSYPDNSSSLLSIFLTFGPTSKPTRETSTYLPHYPERLFN